MTDEQRAKRIHHHMYETCEGIAEHAERIVRLEDENEKLRIIVCNWYPHMVKRVGIDALTQWGYMDVLRELGIEVTENE